VREQAVLEELEHGVERFAGFGVHADKLRNLVARIRQPPPERKSERGVKPYFSRVN
jgi:hypothetical protein